MGEPSRKEGNQSDELPAAGGTPEVPGRLQTRQVHLVHLLLCSHQRPGQDWVRMYSRTPLVRPPLLHQKSPFKRGGLSKGLDINTLLDLQSQVTSPEGMTFQKGGLSKGLI